MKSNRPSTHTSKPGDDQLRGALLRVGLTITALLAVVYVTYRLTFSSNTQYYQIKGNKFHIPPECMDAVESGRARAQTDKAVADLQGLQGKTLPRDRITLAAFTTLEDTGRFMVLMASLRKYLDTKDVKKLLLVVPDNQAFAFQSIASYNIKVPLEIVGEEKLSYSSMIRGCEEHNTFKVPPKHCTKCFSGYSNQMLLKLLIAAYVDTEFYLTLDADTLLRKPFELDLLISAGRATYNPQSYSQGSNWFDSSASALQMVDSACMVRARKEDPESLTFGVTPAILSRTLALKTVERLVSLYGTEFEILLHALNVHGGFNSDNFWTEYTMYAIVACNEKLFSSFHKKLASGVYAEDVSAVWLNVQAPYWNASLAFSKEAWKSDPAPFTVFQSRTGVPVTELAAHVQPFLQVSS